MPWQTPVFDRTAADVAAHADKCYFSAALLNRIEGNIAVLAAHFGVAVHTRSWADTDFLTPGEMTRILADLQAVRNAYYTLPGTPDTPSLPATVYTDVNAIEQILWSVRELRARNLNPDRYTYAGETIGVI